MLDILFVLLGGVVAVVLVLYVIGRRAIRKAAANIHAQGVAIYGGAHEYAVTSPSEFPHADVPYYDRTQQALELQGFTLLADIADLTVNGAGGQVMPTFVRVMEREGGAILAAMYHARVVGAPATGKGNFHALDFETPISDGSFVMTTNAPFGGNLDEPPEFVTEHMPPDTAVDVLLARHRDRVLAHLADHPGTQPLGSRTIEDVIAHQQRLDELKAAFRAGRPAIFSQEELNRLAPDSRAGAEAAWDVGKELERLKAR